MTRTTSNAGVKPPTKRNDGESLDGYTLRGIQ